MLQKGPHVRVKLQHAVLRMKTQVFVHGVPGKVMYKQTYLCSWDASGEAVPLLSSIQWIWIRKIEYTMCNRCTTSWQFFIVDVVTWCT